MAVGSGCLAGASTLASGLGKIDVLQPLRVAHQYQLPAVAACIIIRILDFEGTGRLPWGAAIPGAQGVLGSVCLLFAGARGAGRVRVRVPGSGSPVLGRISCGTCEACET